MIKHYPNCNSTYPEKPKDQAPQEEIEIVLEDGSGDIAVVCCDCGAVEIRKGVLEDGSR